MSASHKEELAHRLVVITRDKHTYEPPKSHFTYFETNNADAECVFTLVSGLFLWGIPRGIFSILDALMWIKES